jgi:hypothetical protein
MSRRLVNIFLIRIIKGIDCGDDVPRLCWRGKPIRCVREKRVRNGQQTETYVGGSIDGTRSSVDWTRGTSRSLKARGIVPVTLGGGAVFGVKVGQLREYTGQR